ncbi:MAG TPA: hypothetical protein VFM68_01295 [Candidatus Saccharimonadales bacterium]|nr:hypothetical protein [Candidatus Saccharimonadales bacterium]
MARSNQGGSVLSFIIVGSVLTALLVGSAYFVQQRSAQSVVDQTPVATEPADQSGDEANQPDEIASDTKQKEEPAPTPQKDTSEPAKDKAEQPAPQKEDTKKTEKPAASQDEVAKAPEKPAATPQPTTNEIPTTARPDVNPTETAKLPETGPAETIVSFLGAGLLVGATIAYIRSRLLYASL